MEAIVALEVGARYAVRITQKLDYESLMAEAAKESERKDPIQLKASLGGNDLFITSQEELEFLYNCHKEDELTSSMPMVITVDPKGEELSFQGEDSCLVLLTNIPSPSNPTEWIESISGISTSVHEQTETYVVVRVADPSEVTKLVKKAMKHSVSAVPMTGKTGGHSYFFAGMTVKLKKKKANTSTTSSTLNFKPWKAEYLRRKERATMRAMHTLYEVEMDWGSSGSSELQFNGTTEQVKLAKKELEVLSSGLVRSSQFNFPVSDRKHALEVANLCRMAEQANPVAVILSEDSSTGGAAGIRLNVFIVSQDAKLADKVIADIRSQQRETYECKLELTKEETELLVQLKKQNPENFTEMKQVYKLQKFFVIKGSARFIGYEEELLNDAVEAVTNVVRNSSATGSPQPTRKRVAAAPASSGVSQRDLIAPEEQVPEFVGADAPAEDGPDIFVPLATATPVSDNPFVKNFGKSKKLTRASLSKAEMEELGADLPDTWTPMPKHANSVAVLLDTEEDEYQMVEQLFDMDVDVTSVERIQNKKLWREFQSNTKGANETLMWMGTGSEKPEDVYAEDCKLMGDLWKKASFCNVFAFSTETMSRQLFLCYGNVASSGMMHKNVEVFPCYLVTYDS